MEKQLGGDTAQVSITEPLWHKEKSKKIIRQQFIKALPSIDSLINRTVLKGKYIDQNGQILEFTDDLMAIWPQKKFKYEICKDIIGD